MQNYTNIFLFFFPKHTLVLPPSVSAHACMKIAFELGIKRLDGVFRASTATEERKTRSFHIYFIKCIYLPFVLLVNEHVYDFWRHVWLSYSIFHMPNIRLFYCEPWFYWQNDKRHDRKKHCTNDLDLLCIF